MKTFLTVLSALLMIVFASACNGSSDSGNENPDEDASSEEQDAEENDADESGGEDPDDSSAEDEKTESIRNLAEEYVRFSNGTGVVIGYGKDKLASVSYGIRDSRTQEPLSTDDLFDIGSITKNFTAVTMLLLQEEGKIDLDQTIDKWFPDFEKGDIITVRMLLNHTSGILEWNEFDNNEEVVEKVNGKFIFEPGTDWSYCNTNFILAGLIINRIEGKDAHEVIREKILDPLGMTHTFMKESEEYPLEEKAHGHTFDEYGNIVPYEIHENFWTAGGIVSNVEDMFKYAHALFNGELLSQESMEQMLDMVKVSGIPVYGLGIMYGSGSHGDFYNHGGDVLVAAAFMAYYPETEEIHIIFNNFGSSSATLGILNDWMEYVLEDDESSEKGTSFPDWNELVESDDDTQIFTLYAPLPDYPAEELGNSIGYFVYPGDYYPDSYCLHYLFKYQAYVKIIQECPESERYYEGSVRIWRTDIDMYLSAFEAALESGEPLQDFYITKYDLYYDLENDSISRLCYSKEESDPDKYMMISSSPHPSGTDYYRIWGRSKMAESSRAVGCECYNEDGTERECGEEEIMENGSVIRDLPPLL